LDCGLVVGFWFCGGGGENKQALNNKVLSKNNLLSFMNHPFQ